MATTIIMALHHIQMGTGPAFHLEGHVQDISMPTLDTGSDVVFCATADEELDCCFQLDGTRCCSRWWHPAKPSFVSKARRSSGSGERLGRLARVEEDASGCLCGNSQLVCTFPSSFVGDAQMALIRVWRLKDEKGKKAGNVYAHCRQYMGSNRA
jgi:hypothetical protein